MSSHLTPIGDSIIWLSLQNDAFGAGTYALYSLYGLIEHNVLEVKLY